MRWPVFLQLYYLACQRHGASIQIVVGYSCHGIGHFFFTLGTEKMF